MLLVSISAAFVPTLNEGRTLGKEGTSGFTDLGVFPSSRHRSDLFRKLERRGNKRLNMVCWYRIRCYWTWQVSPEGREIAVRKGSDIVSGNGTSNASSEGEDITSGTGRKLNLLCGIVEKEK